MKFFNCLCQQDSKKERLIIKSMSTKTGNQIAPVSRNWDRDTPNSYQKKQRLTMLMDMATGAESPLTHVKRNLILLCLQYVKKRLPFRLSMSRETLLCFAHVNRDSAVPSPMSTETSLCSAHVNRDSSCPCQEQPHSALPTSTEIPLAHVKSNLTLHLPMTRETSLCSYPCQGKTHSALTHVKGNLTLLLPM